ncbi:MAG: anti-sigma factor family protein [Candidatus Dormibacteria bacterium]
MLRILQAYLDGELDADRAAMVTAHLAEDFHRCGLEAEAYRAIKAALAKQGPTVDPATLERLRRFPLSVDRGDHP